MGRPSPRSDLELMCAPSKKIVVDECGVLIHAPQLAQPFRLESYVLRGCGILEIKLVTGVKRYAWHLPQRHNIIDLWI